MPEILRIILELMLLIQWTLNQKITCQTAVDNHNGNVAGRVDVEIMVS